MRSSSLGSFLVSLWFGGALGLLFTTGTLGCEKPSQDKQSAPVPNTEPKAEIAPAEDPKPPPPPEPAPAKEPEPPPRRYVVAVLGDSITDAKVGGGGYLEVLREACPRSQFINFGKGGDMMNQMRRRFEREILPQVKSQNIDTLLVYGGVNDLYSDLTAGRTNDRIEADLLAVYQQAKQAGLTVIAVTVSPWGGFSRYWNPRRGENTRLLNSWILGQVARGPVDKAVDSFAPLSCGNRDVLCPEYETPSHDGLHPGKKGHAILGEKLAKEAFIDCL